MSPTDDYEIVITQLPQEDGGGFAATVPELPGCMSDGETQEEALANVRDAIHAWVATADKMGRTFEGIRDGLLDAIEWAKDRRNVLDSGRNAPRRDDGPAD